MRFDPGTRTRILADMTLDFDPTGSTIEVGIEGTWYPATWQDAPVETATPTGTRWKQTARTTAYFTGTPAISGATVLATGRHLTETRVTQGTDIIVADSSPIDVR